MKIWSEWSRVTKIMVIGGSLGVLLGSGVGGYHVYNEQQHQMYKQEIGESLKEVKETGNLAKVINSFTDEQGFLTTDISQEEVVNSFQKLLALEIALGHYQEKYPKDQLQTEEITTLKTLLTLIQKKIVIQNDVNALFQQEDAAINGSTVHKEVILADNVDDQMISAIDPTFLEEDEWKNGILSLINQAKAQLEDILTAENAISECYTKGKVKEDITKKAYEEAKTLVSKVKRPSSKTTLDKKLEEIKKVVDANEKKAKAEAEKKKQEQSKKEAEEAARQSGGTVIQKEDGTYEVVGGDSSNQYVSKGESELSNGNTHSTGNSYVSGNNSSHSTGSINNRNQWNGSNSTQNTPSGNSSAGNIGTNNGGSGQTGGSNNGNNQSGITPSIPEKPKEPTIVSGYIGNSGKVFDTALEANTWANNILDTDFSKNGYYLVGIFYSDGSEKFSIDWY